MSGIDELWADLLSADSARIWRAWNGLRADERQAVLEHLTRMRDDEGWHRSQRDSAMAALRAIQPSA